MANKYGAIRTWSELNQRMFASKAEATRADELKLLEMGGVIKDLKFQPRFVLCLKPHITYTADFEYHEIESGRMVVEDVKGVLTRETRVKLAWTKERYGVNVELIR